MSPVDAMARFRATRLVAPTGFDYFVVFYISSNYSHDLLAFTESTEKKIFIDNTDLFVIASQIWRQVKCCARNFLEQN